MSREIIDFQDANQSLDDLVSELEQKLQSITDNNQSLEDLVSELEQKLQSVSHNEDKIEILKLTNLTKAFTNEISSKNKKIEKLSTTIDSMQDKLQCSERMHMRTIQECDTERGKKTEYKSSLKDLKKKITELEHFFYDEVEGLRERRGEVGGYDKENLGVGSGNYLSGDSRGWGRGRSIGSRGMGVGAGSGSGKKKTVVFGGDWGDRDRDRDRKAGRGEFADLGLMEKFQLVVGKFERKLKRIQGKVNAVNLNESLGRGDGYNSYNPR
jgi:hypothetical protein